MLGSSKAPVHTCCKNFKFYCFGQHEKNLHSILVILPIFLTAPVPLGTYYYSNKKKEKKKKYICKTENCADSFRSETSAVN